MKSTSSFRPIILEGVKPFAELFGDDAKAASEILAETIVRVSISKEEGLPLSPVVYLAHRLDELLDVAKGTYPLEIGKGPAEARTVQMGLKCCAPLGEGRQWATFFILQGSELHFGVFCTERSPLKMTSFAALRRQVHHRPIVGVTRLGQSVIELNGGKLQHFFEVSGARDLTGNPAQVLKSFVAAVTRDVPEQYRDTSKAFYYRIGVDLISGNHGALIAVLQRGESVPPWLADGIWLDDPLSIVSRIKSYEETPSESEAFALGAHGTLIRRMVSMDGVTIFGPDGTLRAYNCFIRHSAFETPAQHVIGGARRRAFEILCNHVGDSMTAVFYRSQDGSAEFKKT